MATPLRHTVSPLEAYPEARLPESDGKPMAETDTHREIMMDVLDALEEYYRDDEQVYVSGNIFVYYRDETDELKSVSPDILVVRGVKKQWRRIYNIEAEGKVPDVVIKLTSASTKMEDLGNKRFIYASLGVKEYFIFDPLGEIIQPALKGFRLGNGDYTPLPGNRLYSEVLGLELRMEKGLLRLFNPKTGAYLLTRKESHAARQKAEAEILRLREELVKLKGKQH